VAGVTKLLFARVTLHTGHHQTFLIFLAFQLESTTITGPQDIIPPGVQQFHVLGANLGRRQNTGFGIFGQHGFWWFGPSAAAVVPDGYGDKQDKNYQSRDYFTAIIHRTSSLPAGQL
jgi:hypothetical protein